ncbi:hypothetical protein COLO4_34637 [Corchorus olitorius]|uniref:BZIP domain-containing protein n=1 Tax=Corchorus olitorius TaxID=93759 RepID=A0A1R3GK49_9ROSI|nr:hypothetical protein COLO4_34637 [Corchorus olitorius]
MLNPLPQMSSGSEAEARGGDGMIMDEKKRKRMLSNRESARRSRMKKQKLLEDLVNEVASLKAEIRKNSDNFEILMQKTLVLESENNLLEAEKMDLAHHLRNLEFIQTHMELLQMNNNNLESWQCHGSSQPMPIMASAGMFNY